MTTEKIDGVEVELDPSVDQLGEMEEGAEEIIPVEAEEEHLKDVAGEILPTVEEISE